MGVVFFIIIAVAFVSVTVYVVVNNKENEPISHMEDANDFKRVCYFRNFKWSHYAPEDMDAQLCSHILFMGTTIIDGKLQALDPKFYSKQGITGWYQRFKRHIRDTSSSTKVMLTVFISSHDTALTTMLNTKSSRSLFINDAIEYVRERDFDGIDLDFEVPGLYASPPSDKRKFTYLCQEMREAIDEEKDERSDNKKKLILTAAVESGDWHIKQAYEVEQLCKVLDFVNIMTYGMGLAQSQHNTIHHSPLFPPAGSTTTLSLSGTSRLWIDGGCPPQKIAIGMAFFAMISQLKDAENNGISAPIVEGSHRSLGYSQVCAQYLSNPKTIVRRDPVQQIPYLSLNTTWVGYDDPYSLSNKVHWLKSVGLGGWMVWVLDTDDYNNKTCNAGTYPLLRSLNRATTTC